MYVCRLECPASDKERVVAEFWERGTTGIIERELPGGRVLLEAFFDERKGLDGDWEEVENRDWVAVSRAQWTPLLVGERFYLAPEGSAQAAPEGRIRLEMRAGLACGSGWGEATQLALEGMEATLRPGMAVLDVGTGSGILAEAAARLGAARVWACDIDFDAARIAHGRCLESPVEGFCGTPRAVRSGTADLVVANINAETLAGMASELRRVTRPGGALELSGFPERHLERILEPFGRPERLLEKREWRAAIIAIAT